MNLHLSSRALFALGFVLLIGVNIAVLLGVSRNRSGSPDTEISLTERELQLSRQWVKENSGLSLQLIWRTLSQEDEYTYFGHWGRPVWLNADKLEELGFRIGRYLQAKDKAFRSRRFVAKQVFVVLENDGDLYREAVRRVERAVEKKKEAVELNSGDQSLRHELERAEDELQRERTSASRLFAVDAGLDPSKLREKYQDRTRFIITKGLVEPGYLYSKEREEIFGQINAISRERIHVPLEYRRVFDAVLSRNNGASSEERPPRYQVELAYGRRFEPWIVSVQELSDEF